MLRRNPDEPPTPMKALLNGLVGSVAMRRTAAYELGFHNTDDAIPILVKLLNDSDEFVRVYAIHAMVNLKNKSVVSLLIDYASRLQPGLVLTNTIRALAELGDESAGSVLCKLLSAKDSMIRYDAVFALGEIADETVISALSRLTSDKTMPNSGEDEETIWSIGALAKRAIHKIKKRQSKAKRE